MQTSETCAVVVTFHPDSGVLENLAALKPQVERLIVVDNGSPEALLAPLRQAAGEGAFALIENGENLGIATALNVGIRRALAEGVVWIFLFDQDSQVTDGFAATMLACFAKSAWGGRLGILVPRYVDRRLDVVIPPNLVAEGLEAAMTSGSLLEAATFTRHGLFLDELFIDGVDYEYSLRLRAAGLVIAECSEAILLHSPGEPRVFYLRGRRLFQTANYSPLRRYYQERNKIWNTRRYLRQFPVFCMKLFLFSTKDFVKILVAEKDSLRKARFFLRGMVDGVLGRMGRLDV